MLFPQKTGKDQKKEINYLFALLENFLRNKLINFEKYNIKLNIIGKKNFSKKLNYLLKKSEQKTKNNTKLQVNLALNYGSRSEIVNAVNKLKKKI